MRAVVLWMCAVLLTASPLLATAEPDPNDLPWPTSIGWKETQALAPDDMHDPHFHLNFGAHVAIDGTTLLVSTQFDKFNDEWLSCPEIGHNDGCDWVYVFTQNGSGEWLQTAKLVPDDAQLRDTFGYSIAVDEASGVIAVGNPGVKVQANKVYIFERQPDGGWYQTARFNWTNNGDSQLAAYGQVVAVSGHTVVTSGGDPRRLHIMEKLDGVWRETAILLGGATAHGVTIAGDRMVAAVLHYFDGCKKDNQLKGIFYVYERNNGTWNRTAVLDPSAEHHSPSTVGGAVALNEAGDVLVIGAPLDRRVLGVPTEPCLRIGAPEPIGTQHVHFEPGAAGAVGSAWIYEYRDGEWVQTADIQNPTPNLGHVMYDSTFGYGIDASGKRVVIGSDCDFYNAGMCSGAAFVYEQREDHWALVAKLRRDDAASGDWFGLSVGVSGDTVLVGADLSSKTGSAHLFSQEREIIVP